jgi:intermediate peptidase
MKEHNKIIALDNKFKNQPRQQKIGIVDNDRVGILVREVTTRLKAQDIHKNMLTFFGSSVTRFLGRQRHGCANPNRYYHEAVGRRRTFSSITTHYGIVSRRPSLRATSAFTTRIIHHHRSFSDDNKSSSNKKKIGLFSNPDLHYPNDFQRLTKKAIQESDELRNKIPESIISQNQARETLYQLDQISRAVCNVIDAAELCRSAHADPQWRDAANTAFAQLQDYIATLNTDQRLYNALAIVEKDYYDDLSEEERRFTYLLKREFELDGIHLPDQERENVKQLHNTVTTLETLFANNITNSHKQFWADATLVEDVIPKHVLLANGAIYGNDTQQPERQQQVQLTADTPITHSISSFASSGALRKEVYMESMTSCPENLDVLDAMIDSRHQLAQALSFESYSHRFLQDKMVQSPKAVFDFLNDLQQRIQPAYQKEMSMISHAKQQVEGNTQIEPWDVKFYVKLLKAQGGVDPSALAPYLSLSNCLNAMKKLTSSLFGIRMEEMKLEDGERWDVITQNDNSSSNQQSTTPEKGEEIRKFVVSEEETGRELGTMYLDLHPRPGKYTHAAHFTVRCGCLENGPDSDYQKPIVALVCNMNTGQASFSSHQEVETFLHEYGHAMHSLLSRTNFQHLSGTRAAMDFVETPSHWMEHYAWCKQFLPLLATNENGEPLPESMVEALSQSRNQFRFLEMQNQIVLSKFDQTIFGGNNNANGQRISTKDTWAAMHRQSGVPLADNTHWFTNVGHLVTYGAGYYGYLYSQVFADAIWNELFHNQSLKRSSGERIWKKMLIHGGARDANVMLEDLLGHKPTIDNYWKSLVASSNENDKGR